MSHLQRRYTNHFYVLRGKKLVKKEYLTLAQFQGMHPYSMVPIPGPNGVFPCEHEERDFMPKNGRRSNHTKHRMKRKNKARIRARKAA